MKTSSLGRGPRLAASFALKPALIRRRKANPKAETPVLIHEELKLYDSTVILEDLEDRYPTPALYPHDPAARAGGGHEVALSGLDIDVACVCAERRSQAAQAYSSPPRPSGRLRSGTWLQQARGERVSGQGRPP
jgi:glutathione S-transferase